MLFNLDTSLLARQLLPPLLRTPLLLAILKAAILPLRQTARQLTTLRNDTRRQLAANASTISLEQALCDAFFLTERQIYITTPTPEDEQPEYLSHLWEQQPYRYIHSTAEAETHLHLRHRGEPISSSSFTIHIPTFLCTSLNPADDRYGGMHLSEINRIITLHKPAGRTCALSLYDYE